MNWLAHFFTAFVLAKLIFNVPSDYLPLILIFSALPDIDHFPMFLKEFVRSARLTYTNRVKRKHFNRVREVLLLVINLLFIPVTLFVSSVFDLKRVPFVFGRGMVDGDKRLGSDSRSRYHEFYGVFVFSFVASLVYLLFSSQQFRVVVVIFCLLLHFALDFLVGHTKPFFPYSGQVVYVVTYSRKLYRAVVELAYTLISGGVFWFLIR